MFFKYNALTGRLGTSCQLAAYNPQGLGAIPELGSSTIVFEHAKVKPVAVSSPFQAAGQQRAASSVVNPSLLPKNYGRVAQLQKLYQSNPDIPVHLKGGSPDKILYLTTMALSVAGLVFTVGALYKFVHPAKSE